MTLHHHTVGMRALKQPVFFFFFKSLACFLRVSVVTDSCGARILYSAVKNPHNPIIVRLCLTRWIINHKNGSKYH